MFLLRKWNNIHKNALPLAKIEQMLKSEFMHRTFRLELLRGYRMLELNVLCLLSFGFSCRCRNLQERKNHISDLNCVLLKHSNNTSEFVFGLITCRTSCFNSEPAKQILLKFGIGNLYPNVQEACTVNLQPYYKPLLCFKSRSNIALWWIFIYIRLKLFYDFTVFTTWHLFCNSRIRVDPGGRAA
jgi:hypothetical protein